MHGILIYYKQSAWDGQKLIFVGSPQTLPLFNSPPAWLARVSRGVARAERPAGGGCVRLVRPDRPGPSIQQNNAFCLAGRDRIRHGFMCYCDVPTTHQTDSKAQQLNFREEVDESFEGAWARSQPVLLVAVCRCFSTIFPHWRCTRVLPYLSTT